MFISQSKWCWRVYEVTKAARFAWCSSKSWVRFSCFSEAICTGTPAVLTHSSLSYKLGGPDGAVMLQKWFLDGQTASEKNPIPLAPFLMSNSFCDFLKQTMKHSKASSLDVPAVWSWKSQQSLKISPRLFVLVLALPLFIFHAGSTQWMASRRVLSFNFHIYALKVWSINAKIFRFFLQYSALTALILAQQNAKVWDIGWNCYIKIILNTPLANSSKLPWGIISRF